MFQFFILGSTSISLLESESPFLKLTRNLLTAEHDHFHVYSLMPEPRCKTKVKSEERIFVAYFFAVNNP
jgi:hypothetical protein